MKIVILSITQEYIDEYAAKICRFSFFDGHLDQSWAVSKFIFVIFVISKMGQIECFDLKEKPIYEVQHIIWKL